MELLAPIAILAAAATTAWAIGYTFFAQPDTHTKKAH